jgi:hypothetical protein
MRPRNGKGLRDDCRDAGQKAEAMAKSSERMVPREAPHIGCKLLYIKDKIKS